ncbi:hypothetical protein [Larkinella arboricola]|uniref:hypothetical protein n=1 Tax=Larkinella arboricola TaxID=643671 RepID=UPI001472B0FD|nr:hypothetical protein [Larkinella arboricola]
MAFSAPLPAYQYRATSGAGYAVSYFMTIRKQAGPTMPTDEHPPAQQRARTTEQSTGSAG